MLKQRADARLLMSVPKDAGPRKVVARGAVAHSVWSPGSQTFISNGHCIAVMLAPSPGMRAAFGSDRLQTFDSQTGMITVNPAGLECRLEWSSTKECVVVAIDNESMEDLIEQELDSPNLELRATNRVVDSVALELARLLKSELTQPNLSAELYLDSLITTFGIHVIRRYSTIADPWKPRKSALPINAARRVQEFVLEHLTQRITIADLAATCDLSPGHFSICFARTFGMPPHRYLLERRLDLAEKLLADKGLSISEVAFLTGFSSQSHLTNIMSKYMNVTPNQMR